MQPRQQPEYLTADVNLINRGVAHDLPLRNVSPLLRTLMCEFTPTINSMQSFSSADYISGSHHQNIHNLTNQRPFSCQQSPVITTTATTTTMVVHLCAAAAAAADIIIIIRTSPSGGGYITKSINRLFHRTACRNP
ncbi:Uncharacterized protein FWK35_00001575 [Aphis craccivora]|uniref:Uncharacterized protein n=1 Tax=Aphis craccivora TaxID=307492 RepID=A0A6G0ZPC7_APHCR|nr:Uncharacterized protein FWK35_00001575 [Aphis craccivora]